MGIFGRKTRAARTAVAKFDQLHSDLKTLRKDARQLANGVGEAADSAVQVAGQARDDVGKWATGNVRTVRDSVRGQPLTACLVSLGAGALLGALFFRR